MRGERVCVGDVGGVHGGERGIWDDAGGADCGRSVREHDGGGIVRLAAGFSSPLLFLFSFPCFSSPLLFLFSFPCIFLSSPFPLLYSSPLLPLLTSNHSIQDLRSLSDSHVWSLSVCLSL